MAVLSMCLACGPEPSEQKLADPKMTLQDNPYARGKADPLQPLKRYNDRRLFRDAEMRACPVRGQAYSAIMDTRYKGE